MTQFFTVSFWMHELRSTSTLSRLRIQGLRLTIPTGAECRRQLLETRADSLVYTTILSFVPVLVVMFSVLQAFCGLYVCCVKVVRNTVRCSS